jgi:hypothetical protein
MDRFLAAARRGDILGDIPTIQQLYEGGTASVSEADRDGMIALTLAAHVGRGSIIEWKTQQKEGVSLGSEGRRGLLYLCRGSYNAPNRWGGCVLYSLLVMILTVLGAPPSYTVTYDRHRELIREGKQMHARLPAFLEQWGTLLTTHCPLPTVLHPLIAAYAEPTHADIWESGLL